MGTAAVWIVVECACRILGVSTAAVLCAVGVETLRQGEFHSLAVYLLVSSGGMLVFELSFFTDIMLMWCLPCPPKWKVFILWKKMAKLGGFQKFLYYTLMSVVCFLHPVLVWHAVIPGTMLLVTGFAYFILSKKQKPMPPKEPADVYEDTPTAVNSASDDDERIATYSFLHVVTGMRTSAPSHFSRVGDVQASKDSTQAMLDEHGKQGTANKSSRKREKRSVHFKDKALKDMEEGTEMEEYQYMDQEETTSDKAPMIRP